MTAHTAHTVSLPERDRWLPWVGLAAFVVAALLLIIQSGLPPFPASVPVWAFIVIIGCLLLSLASLTLFLYDVLTRDAQEGGPERRRGAPPPAGTEASPGARAQAAG